MRAASLAPCVAPSVTSLPQHRELAAALHLRAGEGHCTPCMADSRALRTIVETMNQASLEWRVLTNKEKAMAFGVVFICLLALEFSFLSHLSHIFKLFAALIRARKCLYFQRKA